MLFNRYQYSKKDIQKRGYSQSCIAFGEDGNPFWVKWILGIEKEDTRAKILADKLRHLQKARHKALPNIIEYGFDDEQKAFSIIYDYLDEVQTFENKIDKLNRQEALTGMIDLAECLHELHTKYKIYHGDIHPSNILVDKNGQFYLIDFGLADITKTLSQSKDLEVFARSFAAPEKLNRFVSLGFPYQADIYSLGMVIEWFFNERQEPIAEEQNLQFHKLLAENPADRPSWQQGIGILRKIARPNSDCIVRIRFHDTRYKEDIQHILRNNTPHFDISPKDNQNYLMDIVAGDFILEWCQWDRLNKVLIVRRFKDKSQFEERHFLNKKKYSKKLPFHLSLVDYQPSVIKTEDITLYFQKWFEEKKQRQTSVGKNRDAVREELGFYRELIEEEKKVIVRNSLRLQYSGFEIRGDEIAFRIKLSNSNSSIGFIFRHIDEGNDINSEGFEYIISANADRKQNKEVVEFAGKPYDYNSQSNILRIKDCERFKRDSIPQSGYISENTNKLEEEKNRQYEAIRKVDKNEVQNPDLIYFLFRPNELPPTYTDYSPLETVWQKDENGNVFRYSDNQNKAIKNALTKSPLSVIQGPPGTGKTAVITEIVFQILAQKPEAKILITSQTNNAVDQVLENLLRNEIPILRLSGITAPRTQVVKKHTLDRKLEGWKQQVKERAEKNFMELKSTEYLNLNDLHRNWISTVMSLDERSSINQKLIDSIRLIGATCNHIASRRYNRFNFEFDYVIMDESGKATTAEALVPIIMGKNLIFVGDHRQLKPMLTSTREVERWLREKFNKEAEELENWDDYFNRPSLFEQVITNIEPDYKAQLTECRRSSAEQVKLTSKCFYEAEGDEKIKAVKRDVLKEHNLPLAIDSSILFVDIGSNFKNETEAEKNQSSFNKVSANTVGLIIEQLDKYAKVKEYSIGIITCYTAQYRHIKNQINRKIQQRGLDNIRKWNKPEEKLTISVVDRFQGMEKDIIIVDLVKSGVGLNLGFLEVPNRINVALSRQKKLLIIVGDYHGIINARTKLHNGEKVALQKYLEAIKPTWVVKAEELKGLFK